MYCFGGIIVSDSSSIIASLKTHHELYSILSTINYHQMIKLLCVYIREDTQVYCILPTPGTSTEVIHEKCLQSRRYHTRTKRRGRIQRNRFLKQNRQKNIGTGVLTWRQYLSNERNNVTIRECHNIIRAWCALVFNILLYACMCERASACRHSRVCVSARARASAALFCLFKRAHTRDSSTHAIAEAEGD